MCQRRGGEGSRRYSPGRSKPAAGEAVNHAEIALRAKPYSPAYLRAHGELQDSLAVSLSAAGRIEEAIVAAAVGPREHARTFAAHFPDPDQRLPAARRRPQRRGRLRLARPAPDAQSSAIDAFHRSRLEVFDSLVVNFPQDASYREGREAIRGELARASQGADAMPDGTDAFLPVRSRPKRQIPCRPRNREIADRGALDIFLTEHLSRQ